MNAGSPHSLLLLRGHQLPWFTSVGWCCGSESTRQPPCCCQSPTDPPPVAPSRGKGPCYGGRAFAPVLPDVARGCVIVDAAKPGTAFPPTLPGRPSV